MRRIPQNRVGTNTLDSSPPAETYALGPRSESSMLALFYMGLDRSLIDDKPAGDCVDPQ